MTALVPVFLGRPAIVTVGGCVFYVSVHDAAHLAERKAWLARLEWFHPDRRDRRLHRGLPGSAKSFRDTQRAYSCWLRREAAWYAAVRVAPPVPIKKAAALLIEAAPLVPCRGCGRAFTPRAATKHKAATVYCTQPCQWTAQAAKRRRK